MASAMTAMNESRLRVRATTVRNRVIQDEFDLVRAGGDSDTCTNAQHSARSEEPGDGAVLDGDGRGVAGDHRGAAPAAGELHGGGRGAAADELRRQAPASGVRRHTLEADHVGQNLDAAVDLVRAERDDAVGRGGLLRRAQRVDGAGEGDRRAGAGPRGGPRRWPSRPARGHATDPARPVCVMSSQTRAAISDRRNPAQNASAMIAASRRPRAAAGCGRLPPPPAALGPAGSSHHVERGGLAGRRRGHGGVLARDPAQRVGDPRKSAAPQRGFYHQQRLPAASSSGPPARRRAPRPRSSTTSGSSTTWPRQSSSTRRASLASSRTSMNWPPRFLRRCRNAWRGSPG